MLTRWCRLFKQEVIYIQGAKFKRGSAEGDLFVSIRDKHIISQTLSTFGGVYDSVGYVELSDKSRNNITPCFQLSYGIFRGDSLKNINSQ